jgi:phage head maturation protease
MAKVNHMKRMFAEISKVEEQDDGTLKVWGYASANCVDSDGETITTDAMRNALPDYMKFGAVREMHQAMAAGTAIEASIEETTGKTYFGAHVVDPVAVLKVQTGTYKGFSIGGKVTERDTTDKKIIKALKLVEVSLVDRPANPEAVFTVYKSEKEDDMARTPEDDITDLAAILDKGEVTPATILGLIKSHQAVPVVPVVPEPQEVTKTEPVELKKGMYQLSDFACLLSSISYLAMDAQWESEYEGDSSPIPAALRDWLKAGLAVFVDMAAEETAELMAALNAQAGVVDVIQMADGKLTIQKKGAKFSKDTAEKLGNAHEAMKTACDHMDKLGYKESDDTESAATAPTQKNDTNGIVPDEQTLQKAVSTAVSEAIAPLTDSLTKLGKENEELQARLTELGKRAAPGKALLKAVSINKSTDNAPLDTDTSKSLEPAPAEGTQERAAYEMRKVFSNGGKRLA